jgi:hypothetical protein
VSVHPLPPSFSSKRPVVVHCRDWLHLTLLHFLYSQQLRIRRLVLPFVSFCQRSDPGYRLLGIVLCWDFLISNLYTASRQSAVSPYTYHYLVPTRSGDIRIHDCEDAQICLLSTPRFDYFTARSWVLDTRLSHRPSIRPRDHSSSV